MTESSVITRYDDHRCGSKQRRRDGTCTLPAGWGTDHVGVGRCKLHGGNTPSQVANARTEQARRAVATYGLPVAVDPGEALLAEVARTNGHVLWLVDVIRRQDPDALVWGVTEETERGSGEFPGVDVKQGAAPSVWVELYLRERRHLLEVSKTVIALGLEARRVRLAEAQGALMAAMFRGALDDAALPAEMRAVVESAFARRLQGVLGGDLAIEGEVVR
jgi:hypothetical protein